MKSVLAMLVFAVVLSGCAEAIVASVTPEQAVQMTSDQLCTDYAIKHTSVLKAELIKRNVLTPQEWIWIQNGALFIGESQLGVECTFAVAYSTQDITDSSGTTQIVTYQDIGFVADDYTEVWIHNGVVTNISHYSLPSS